jgi:hypothetical protein
VTSFETKQLCGERSIRSRNIQMSVVYDFATAILRRPGLSRVTCHTRVTTVTSEHGLQEKVTCGRHVRISEHGHHYDSSFWLQQIPFFSVSAVSKPADYSSPLPCLQREHVTHKSHKAEQHIKLTSNEKAKKLLCPIHL